MQLLLVRHAIAAERGPVEWPDDSQRPLTAQGEARFRPAARGLALLVPNVDQVLSSPYPRAFRTAEILRDEASWPEPTRCPELQAERRADETLGLIDLSQPSVAFVGHEPLLSSIASLLLTGDAAVVRSELKKGGAMALELSPRSLGPLASLSWSVPPRVLRKLGTYRERA